MATNYKKLKEDNGLPPIGGSPMDGNSGIDTSIDPGYAIKPSSPSPYDMNQGLPPIGGTSNMSFVGGFTGAAGGQLASDAAKSDSERPAGSGTGLFSDLMQSGKDFLTQKATAVPAEALDENVLTGTIPGKTPTESVLPPVMDDPTDEIDELSTGQEAENLLDKQVLADARGEGTEVTAARNRLDREKTLRLEEAQRYAHDRAVQSGYRPGTAQYDEMMRTAQSDATRQNIEAENELNEFARTSRKGSREELAALGERDYGREREIMQDAESRFENFVKYIPSDLGQQMAALNDLSGGNMAEFVKGMYNDDGTLKDVYKDPTAVQTAQKNLKEAFSGVTVHPETGEVWTDADKNTYVEKLWSQMQQNIYDPVTEEGERKEEMATTEGRIKTAIESKNYDSLTSSDWQAMTETDRADLLHQSTSFDDMGNKSDNWDKMDNITVSQAERIWLRNNPISQPDMKGKIVTKGGVVYKITVPMEVHQYPGGNNKKIYVKAINTETGEEKIIYKSDIFESKSDWNPFD